MGWRNIALVAALLVATATCRASGQDAYARAAYGKGVHAYNSGRMQEAERLFNDAIQAGSRDPRFYYFRGLTYLKTGQQYAAEGDFRLAATLESQSEGKYDIGQSLSRVQGSERVALEQVRREAKQLVGAGPPTATADSPFANPNQEVEPLAPASRPRKANRVLPSVDSNALPEDPTDPFGENATEPPVTEVVTPTDGDVTMPDEKGPADTTDDSNDIFGSPDDTDINPFPDDPAPNAGGSSVPSGPTGEGTSAAVRSLFRVLGGSIPRPSLPGNLPLPGMPAAEGPTGPGNPPASGPGDETSPFDDVEAEPAFGDPEPPVAGPAAADPAAADPAAADPAAEMPADGADAETPAGDDLNPFGDQ